MGYRTYIGKISKTEWEKITDLSREEFYKLHDEDIEDGYVSMREMCEELYEFGKYTEFDDSKFYTPFFRNTETQKYYSSDHDLHIVGKDFFEHVINHYVGLIKKYYENLLKSFWDSENRDFNLKNIDTPEGKKSTIDCVQHCRSLALEWGVTNWFTERPPFNLESDTQTITTSWKYEYSIFELVRLYKTFDWENDLLIYYGW